MRQIFVMPESDQRFLDSSGLQWETISDTNNFWVIIHRYSLPDGYNHKEVSLAIQVPPGYPDTQLDMVYFKPALVRLDGKQIPAISTIKIDEQSWQRWSRHRTKKNPWRSGEDDLAAHILLIENWLEREFERDH